MRHDSDFAGYVAARWSSLVRTLVLLGSPPRVAEEIALDALARCYPQWGRIEESDDIDVHVYRTLLECRDRSRIAWWSDDEPDEEPEDCRDLEKVLDRLEPVARRLLVLRFVSDLSEQQVSDVLGGHVPRSSDLIDRSPDEKIFREVSESIEVRPPGIEAVRHRVHEQRRRRGAAVLSVSFGLLVVVGLGTWLAIRPAEPDTSLSIAPVQRQENPSGMTWFANGVLHLDHVRVALPPVQQIAVINGGAVYGDGNQVVFVADDGARTRLGRKVTGAALAASDKQGWVAWIDPGGGSPEVVVYDLTSRSTVARTALNGDADKSRPIAIDQDRVFFETPTQDYEWQPLSGDPEIVAPRRLLDVSSAVRVFQSDPETISIRQPFFNIVIDRMGKGAQLSADGNYVLTHTDNDRSAYGTIHIYDTRSGNEIGSGLSEQDLPIAAELGPERTVTYVVGQASDVLDPEEFLRLSRADPYELRTCSFDTGECVADTKFPNVGSTPLLAR